MRWGRSRDPMDEDRVPLQACPCGTGGSGRPCRDHRAQGRRISLTLTLLIFNLRPTQVRVIRDAGTDVKRFVNWGKNEDRTRTRLFCSVGVCDGGRNAADVKGVQSTFALHQLRPEGRGAKKDLLLQLQKLGRRHNGRSLRRLPTLEVAVEAQSKRPIRTKRKTAVIGDESVEISDPPTNSRVFLTASARGRSN
jgi:hypothetical protein